jgi:lipoprotein NlpI
MPTIVIAASILLGLPMDDKEDLDQLLFKARASLQAKKIDEALVLANRAVERAPKDARAYFFRGIVRGAAHKSDEAVADFDKCLELDPKMAESYQQRGGEYFKLAKINQSLVDFDKFLEMRPDERPGHWQRGISLYYAGKYKEGAEQFKAGDKVFADDVENAVWHYLCNEKVVGAGKARAALLKIGTDKRVPMMVVYDLFAGKAKPEDVIAAVDTGNPKEPEVKSRQFYSHLYLGLYYDSTGDKKKAMEHLQKAGADKAIGGYMGDVARVHVQLMRTKAKEP